MNGRRTVQFVGFFFCMSSVLGLHSILSYCVSFAKDSIAASNIAKSLFIDCVIFARGIYWILPSDPIVALAPPPSLKLL